MKKSLYLLLLTGISITGYGQSSLYQTSKIKELDDNFELYQKNLFSASKYEFDNFRLKDLDEEPQVQADFLHAVSALKIDDPAASDLVYYFMRKNPDHPTTNQAAHLLGDFFFEKRNYRESIRAFQKVNLNKVDFEQGSEVNFKIGYGFFQLKDNNNALRYFNAVKLQPNQYKPDAHYYAGFIALEQGNFNQAIADFKEADKAAFYASKVPYMLAGAYYKQGQYDELINYAEPVLANRRNLDRREEIHLYLAEAYFEKRNFPKAAANYDAFVNARRGELTRAQIYKAGIAQFEIQNFQRATDYLKVSAVENDEIGQVSSYYLGHAYLKLNNIQFASNSFNAAFKSDANRSIKEDALINYAKVNLERGSFQDAVNALDTYLDNYPNGRYAREAESLLTDALINTNNYLRAIEHIEKMPRKSDRIREAYQKITFYQGIVYYRDKRYDLATTYFDKSLSTPVDRDLVVQVHFWKGENFAAKGDLNQAIRSYEAVQASRPRANDPFLIKSYYGLGYALFNSEQYARAEVQFRNYVDRLQGRPDKENYDEALIRLGDTYYVQKKFADAQNTFQRAIRERSDYIDYAYFRSGVVYNFQNRNSEAIQQMNMLINNYPNSLYLEDAIFQKAQINMEEMNYAEARDGFTRLINTRPNSPFIPFALEGRAVANFSLQNYNATIDDYKRILENHPNSNNAQTALVGLQEALALQGRSAEFSQYASRYRSANPDNRSLQNLEFESAKSLYFANSWEQSIRAFEEYLRNYPQASNRAEAVFFIAESHYRAGRKEKALDFFYQIDRERESPQRLRAVQRIAAIEMENKNFQKALPYLRESARNARNQIEEYEALNGLMQAHYQTTRFDSALFYADRVIALGSVTGDAIPEALLLKAKAYQRSNQVGRAEETLRDLINEYKSVQGAEGLFLLAESYHKRGSFSQSNDVIFDFSSPYSGYDYWYGRCFILLAENYLKLGEEFQAKATLESIVERSTNPEIKKMAQEKLSSIK
ncbi:tetratricopeptide repeat protein [Cecembia calidifontis]|uniref:Outer membrane protein assembly factor BamD (BamD/ComL family) n=1 Tax=Cecembia calidifontis TaxID=1187080 RepID=A0A4Q7PFH5_9BACT|nr:tetratricopeptide repeat protein [Cecembia calidifontis]RZS97612.1 outer membrane protein assembly factor BamD (BamD/ComL family) [Cecembia calidifontis]